MPHAISLRIRLICGMIISLRKVIVITGNERRWNEISIHIP